MLLQQRVGSNLTGQASPDAVFWNEKHEFWARLMGTPHSNSWVAWAESPDKTVLATQQAIICICLQNQYILYHRWGNDFVLGRRTCQDCLRRTWAVKLWLFLGFRVKSESKDSLLRVQVQGKDYGSSHDYLNSLNPRATPTEHSYSIHNLSIATMSSDGTQRPVAIRGIKPNDPSKSIPVLLFFFV
jgi:hypothetical protein